MCPNGHDTDQIEVKDNGARVCRACKNHYFSTRIRTQQTRKVTRPDAQRV